MGKHIKDKKINYGKISEVLLETPSIDIISNREASLYGAKGIIEYTKDLIRLNCGHMTVSFHGADLNMKALSVEDVIIKGKFAEIEFTDC